MYTSDIDIFRKGYAKTAFNYLLISLFCGFFGAVYELFSHEVYSFYMLYAFAFPLAGGTLPFLAMSLFRVKKHPSRLSKTMYHCGIATLTVGSIVCGILEIYGTTNRLTGVYWIVGAVLVVIGLGAYFMQQPADRRF